MVNNRFIIDSGAEISAIPPILADHHRLNSGFRFQAVYRTSIKTYGQRMLKLDLGIRRSFPHVFIVADVPHHIICVDFRVARAHARPCVVTESAKYFLRFSMRTSFL